MKKLVSLAMSSVMAFVFAAPCLSVSADENLAELGSGVIQESLSQESYDASSYGLSLPTQKQISQKYKELGIGNASVQGYSVAPNDKTAPYSLGSLNNEGLQEGLNAVNFIRYVAGLPEVTLNESYNELCQAASLVNSVNNSLTHFPTQPSGMSDDMYQMGYDGASSSNLSMGYPNLRSSVIDGYMYDEDSGNIQMMGHRRWILNPSMLQTGFGQVGRYSAMYAFDKSRSGSFTGDYVCWPANNTPYELVSDSVYPFSVSLNSSYDYPSLENVTVEVTSRLENRTWKLNSSNSSYPDNYLTVNNQGYGMKRAIIFCIGELNNNDTYTVKINGVYKDGVEAPIEYTVSIFPIDNPGADIESVEKFVERLYTKMLNRASDSGKATHVNALLNGATAAQVAEGFVLGEELKVWNISNEEFVRRMYLTFLDREADPEGLAVWTSVLDKGCSYGRMFRDFCNSAEFKNVCDSYGINQGSYAITEPRDINENITHYCSRMYTKALGRAYDVAGLNIWTKALLDGTETPESIALTFLDGDEFRMWNHSDEVFVDRLYETLFNRPADAEGKQTWLNLLALGTSRKTAIETFVQSQEFIMLKESLGL